MSKFTDEDDALLDEIGVDVDTNRQLSRTPREERIIPGFEDIQRFVEQHGRAPQHGEDRDILGGCMRCASIGFASWTTVARCLRLSINRGFWRDIRRSQSAAPMSWTTISFSPSSGSRRLVRT